jgi:hypothetical protein
LEVSQEDLERTPASSSPEQFAGRFREHDNIELERRRIGGVQVSGVETTAEGILGGLDDGESRL